VTLSVMPHAFRGVRGRYDLRELRDAAIEQLLEIITEPIPKDADRSFRGYKVSAASRLLSHTEWALEQEEQTPAAKFFSSFKSDTEAARWLTENYDTLLTKAGKSAAVLAESAEQPAAPTENRHGPEAEPRKQNPQDAGEAPSGG
jgi:hypothetical protein